MSDHSRHQVRIIGRYYDNLDKIKLVKLQELVTELYLAESDRKKDQLWKRAAKAMAVLKIPKSIADHILGQRDPELLARHVKQWITKAG